MESRPFHTSEPGGILKILCIRLLQIHFDFVWDSVPAQMGAGLQPELRERGNFIDGTGSVLKLSTRPGSRNDLRVRLLAGITLARPGFLSKVRGLGNSALARLT